jgi:hypothetical protein
MNLSSAIFRQPSRDNPHKGKSGYYSNVHFRIDKNGYTGQGWSDEKKIGNEWVSELKQAFADEIKSLFTAHGWTFHNSERNCICATVVKGKSNLYLHPQDFSGVCENGEIETVRGFLTGADTFMLRAVDIYEEIYDMSDAELTAKLDSEREMIRSEILAAYVTKRRNLFVDGAGPALSIGRRHGVKRLAIANRRSYSGVDDCTDGICQNYAANVFQELLDSGAIVSGKIKNGTGYRSVPKGKAAA